MTNPPGVLPIMTGTERFRPKGVRYMKIVGMSLSEVQECLICGKWEISCTKPVNPLTVGNRVFWRLLSRVSGLNLGPHGSGQQICGFKNVWIRVNGAYISNQL